MATKELILLTFAVLGGLALFILGMNVMTQGLRSMAGGGLRRTLARATGNRFTGITFGTFLGFLIHSSAATVMLVGFVNAGLMSLFQSIPVMLGANVGTTLSMQLISFKLGEYCYIAIALGLLMSLVAPSRRMKNMGTALLGFGILFLGMETMSNAIKPYRNDLAPYLSHINGATPLGMYYGVLTALTFTAVIQSSGATIGIAFALVRAGVFTSVDQVFPIVLGAHIGTCATALLGCIGTNIEARRCAAAHLLFNIINVSVAIYFSEPILRWTGALSSNLVHQTAHIHTAVMLLSALPLLLLAGFYEMLVRLLTYSKRKPPQPSYLDSKLLSTPESAIYAAIRELQRITVICSASLRLNADMLLLQFDRKRIAAIRLNEKVINEIKLAMRDYLMSMTSRYLSRRQAILLQHINRCMTDIERIGDHIEALCDLSIKRKGTPHSRVDSQSMEWLFELYEGAQRVLRLVIASLDPDQKKFQATAAAILEARDDYVKKSIQVKAAFTEKVVSRVVAPTAGMFYMEYVGAFDRIVRHSKSIALIEKQPEFWIKRKKLERKAKDAPSRDEHDPADAADMLDRLQEEDYL